MQRLTERPSKFGATLIYPESAPRGWTPTFVRANGGVMVDPNDDTRCLLDQPAALGALQWHRDRTFKDHIAMPFPELPGTGGNTARITERSRRAPSGLRRGVLAAGPDGAGGPGAGWSGTSAGAQEGEALDAGHDGRVGGLAGHEGAGRGVGVHALAAGRRVVRDHDGDGGADPGAHLAARQVGHPGAEGVPGAAGKEREGVHGAGQGEWADPSGFFRYHKDALDILEPAFAASVRDNQENVTTAMREITKRINDTQKQRAGG